MSTTTTVPLGGPFVLITPSPLEGTPVFGGSLEPGSVAFIVCLLLVVIGFTVAGVLYAMNHGKQEQLDAHRRSQNAAERARAAAADAETIAQQEEDERHLLLHESDDYLDHTGGGGGSSSQPQRPSRARSGTTARNAAEIDGILDEELDDVREAASVAGERGKYSNNGLDDDDDDLLLLPAASPSLPHRTTEGGLSLEEEDSLL